MDVLDKFLRKVSYKFPKGYPDPNDIQDMIMLEGMLKSIIKETPSSEAKEGMDILKSKLGLTDNKFVEISSKRFKILVPRSDRYSYIEKVEGIEGFDYDPNIKGSSIGGITYKNVDGKLTKIDKDGEESKEDTKTKISGADDFQHAPDIKKKEKKTY